METNDIFKNFSTLFEKISNTAEQKGTKLTTIVSGIVILVLIFVKHITISNNIDLNDIFLLCGAFLIIIIGLILSSFEYRWHIQAQLKEKEIICNKFKLESDYNIKRLQITQINKNPGEDIIIESPEDFYKGK